MADVVTGAEFKKEMREGKLKLGLFLNFCFLRSGFRPMVRTAGITEMCVWIR